MLSLNESQASQTEKSGGIHAKLTRMYFEGQHMLTWWESAIHRLWNLALLAEIDIEHLLAYSLAYWQPRHESILCILEKVRLNTNMICAFFVRLLPASSAAANWGTDLRHRLYIPNLPGQPLVRPPTQGYSGTWQQVSRKAALPHHCEAHWALSRCTVRRLYHQSRMRQWPPCQSLHKAKHGRAQLHTSCRHHSYLSAPKPTQRLS